MWISWRPIPAKDACIPHSPDKLACGHGIADVHMSGVGVEDLIKKAVLVSDRDRPPLILRAIAEATLRAKVEAKRKAELEQALKGAHPRDGVYAEAGPDFGEHCAKFNDTVVTFSGKSITTASNICKIEKIRVQLPDTVRVGADCTLQPASDRGAVSVQNVDTTPERENLMFKKIDDKTVILWIINSGRFTGDGRKLSHCSDQVQRAYAKRRSAAKQTEN